MSNYIVSDTDLTSIADAIRAKSSSSSQLSFPTGFVNEIGNIPSTQSAFTLIGTKVFQNVAEWTDTSNADEMDTEINIKNTDYAWGYIVVTCDSEITTTSEWGMTTCTFGRYTSNGNMYATGNIMQKGVATLSESQMVSNTTSPSGYGVLIKNNVSTVIISRKCHATSCPKIRAGNYTVKVYALTSL